MYFCHHQVWTPGTDPQCHCFLCLRGDRGKGHQPQEKSHHSGREKTMLKIPSQMFSKPNMICKQLNTVYCWTLKFQSQMISKQTRFLPLCPLWSSLLLVISFPILLSHPLTGVLPVTFALHYQLQWHPNPLPLLARPRPGLASTDTTSKAPAKTIEGSKAAKKTLEMVAVAAAADGSRKTRMHKDFCHMCL